MYSVPFWEKRGEKVRSLWHLTCQIDDMTGEEAAFAMEACRKTGLLRYMTPIYMKKSRPALALTVLCEETDNGCPCSDPLCPHLYLGVREYPFSRYEMERSTYSISVEGKQIHIKRASGYGISREKAEYEDLSQLAATEGISLRQARERVQQALWLARQTAK